MRLHWNEYLSEMLGTAILLFFGTSVIVMNFGDSSPIKPLISDQNARILLTGLLFAGTASLVAISPFGKLSGGHLNPSLTLSFWLLNKMHHRDLIGYVIFQFVGGVLGSISNDCLGQRILECKRRFDPTRSGNFSLTSVC